MYSNRNLCAQYPNGPCLVVSDRAVSIDGSDGLPLLVTWRFRASGNGAWSIGVVPIANAANPRCALGCAHNMSEFQRCICSSAQFRRTWHIFPRLPSRFLFDDSVDALIGAANEELCGGPFGPDKKFDMQGKTVEACLDAAAQTFTVALHLKGKPGDEPTEVVLRQDHVPASLFPARIGINGHNGTKITLLHDPDT
jgi:hypothetical protein